MRESEVALVNSLTTSILKTSILDAFSNKESDSSYLPDISFSDEDSGDKLMSKIRFITSNSPTLIKKKKKTTKKQKNKKTATIQKNSKGHPKIAGKVPRKELVLSTSTNISTPNNLEVQARKTSKNRLKIK